MNDVVQPTPLTRKDFSSDQDVRWCPGCGDYSILANVQRVLPELGVRPENMVWVSGIGCSSRFPYYMSTYGFHTIHGRAPAIATGIRAANPDLSVWLVTGDGDGLSIGGNHLMHCLRRNVDLRMLLFNNRIYGLTKGQYSPTSEAGKVTKSTPDGSTDYPIDPASLALGCGSSFVARAIDVDADLLGAVLRRAGKHHGSAFVEIYQNCVVFNDGAFDAFTAPEVRPERTIRCEHGKPLLFGKEKNRGLRIRPGTLELEVIELGKDGMTEADVLVHDETNAPLAMLLAHMPFPEFPVATGVLHAVERQTYDAALAAQHEAAAAKSGKLSLQQLFETGETWTV
ncbi:MAG: 2-oxoacid:ferredoxin oxidoreductase subunit beta [Polyangiaceae bacterium]|nr:2-oxoacid:ferredoxin oxidoreductase subunit beta [Polyangiaceae bacterium]